MRTVLLLILSLPLLVQAQLYKARVLDKQTQIPVEGATVYNNRADMTQSDKDGYFSIRLASTDSLFISRIGYTKIVLAPAEHAGKKIIFLEASYASLKDVLVNTKIGTGLLSNVHRIDLTTRPFNNSQEILRIVPGLFIGQHAGGGKAEQLFLRGFDVDHGTDVNITVDGLPVNMVSHAHGQGYADLHFVIPETVSRIDFGKGTYYADKGDFTTAGYVSLSTFDRLPENTLRVEGGMFNTLRTVGMMNLFQPRQKQNAYVAGELYLTDGPFDASQRFRRYNAFGKHQYHFKNTTLTTQISTFWSRWYASGQVPERAISSGMIDWFGAIDPNEGGQTSRTNASMKLVQRLNNGITLENQLFYTRYAFELYSNFTFYKNDPVNGDEIRQKEKRDIIGYNGSFNKENLMSDGATLQTKAGISIRRDAVHDLELSRTYQRSIVTAPLAFGQVKETSASAYVSETYKNKRWTLNATLRYDHFNFQYRDDLAQQPNVSVSKGIVCPKINLQYQVSGQTTLYLKTGRGFHSNDARVVIPQNGRQILPAAWGADLGVIAKPTSKLLINAAVWLLYLDQEFIYVGDEAVVEAGGKTLRRGIDISLRYEIAKHLLADLDANYTIGRATDEPAGQRYLPLAPAFSSTGGLAYTGTRWNAGLRYRWLGNRPANEDNSVVAKGYFLLDANASWHFNKSWSAGFVAENLLNVKWRETQFLTESKLQNEMMPVEEIHITPGSPFFVKLRVSFEF